MITTMPLKEARAPYIQKDNVAGRMFDGLSHAIKGLPTVNVYLLAGGKVKTPLSKISEMEAILAGTFDYTELDEVVTTSSGTIDDQHYASASVKDLEGVEEKAPAVVEGDEFVTVPYIVTGAYQAMKVKYMRVRKDQIRTFKLEV